MESQAIEALLFISGEPLTIKDLVRLSGFDRKKVEEVLGEIEESLKNRGIRLLKHENSVMLTTAPEVSEIAGQIAKERLEGDLSRSALETLSVILWKGRASRSGIDYIRGVHSAFALRTLLIRGLVERVQDPRDARVFLYSATIDLYKYLGISSPKDLPKYDEMKKELKQYD
ncbi:MAG: SMC-Scp complex subunit ScpB [bacterium]|nr:SMC-Scp complex subunit ScpB [bacterium]